MARIGQAVRRYGPKPRRTRTAQLEDVVEWMAARNGLSRGEVLLVAVYLAFLWLSQTHRTPYDWFAGSMVIMSPRENAL